MIMRFFLALSLLLAQAQAITFTMTSGTGLFVGPDGTGSSFDVSSYSFAPGVVTSISMTSGSAAGVGKPQLSTFSFEKNFDASSFPLYRAILSGRSLGPVTLTVKDPNNKLASTTIFTFTGVYVTQIGTTATTGDNAATETFQFVFQTIRMDYTPASNGKIPKTATLSYDVTKNTVQ